MSGCRCSVDLHRYSLYSSSYTPSKVLTRDYMWETEKTKRYDERPFIYHRTWSPVPALDSYPITQTSVDRGLSEYLVYFFGIVTDGRGSVNTSLCLDTNFFLFNSGGIYSFLTLSNSDFLDMKFYSI